MAHLTPPAAYLGIVFGVVYAVFLLIWDALEGAVPAWPHSALKYGGFAVVGGILYGIIIRWLARRYPKPR